MDVNVKACEKLSLCTHENMEVLGAWVYTGMHIDSIFKRYDTIRDAVVEAVKHENAHVLHNGIDIQFGMLADGVAYYTCINTGKVVIIDVTGDN